MSTCCAYLHWRYNLLSWPYGLVSYRSRYQSCAVMFLCAFWYRIYHVRNLRSALHVACASCERKNGADIFNFRLTEMITRRCNCGRTSAHLVGPRYLTMQRWVRSQGSLFGIYGVRTGTGILFYSHVITIPLLLLHIHSSVLRGMENESPWDHGSVTRKYTRPAMYV